MSLHYKFDKYGCLFFKASDIIKDQETKVKTFKWAKNESVKAFMGYVNLGYKTMVQGMDSKWFPMNRDSRNHYWFCQEVAIAFASDISYDHGIFVQKCANKIREFDKNVPMEGVYLRDNQTGSLFVRGNEYREPAWNGWGKAISEQRVSKSELLDNC